MPAATHARPRATYRDAASGVSTVATSFAHPARPSQPAYPPLPQMRGPRLGEGVARLTSGGPATRTRSFPHAPQARRATPLFPGSTGFPARGHGSSSDDPRGDTYCVLRWQHEDRGRESPKGVPSLSRASSWGKPHPRPSQPSHGAHGERSAEPCRAGLARGRKGGPGRSVPPSSTCAT